MANDKSPAGLIITSVIIVTASTEIRDVHEGQTRAAPIVFGFMAALALLVISLGSKTFARGLAVLLLVGAFVVNGPAVAAVVSGISEPNTKKPNAPVNGPQNAGASPAQGGA